MGYRHLRGFSCMIFDPVIENPGSLTEVSSPKKSGVEKSMKTERPVQNRQNSPIARALFVWLLYAPLPRRGRG
jgi:hypothetical protein